MGQARRVVFRLFYSTSFTAVFLIQIVVIAVTPSDAIYESYKRHRLLDIFLLAGTYVLTALIAILIYASRLYTNRSILKDIPKTFMPIDKEDLPGDRVHRLIQECLERSAVIAYQARPRSRRIEHDTVNAGLRMLALTKSPTCTDQTLEPSWGKIAHPGWSSPASHELPNLEYATVVDELIDLVEAKAVSLAPADPLSEPGPDGTPMPDPRVIEEIMRSGNMGMRPYLRYLIDVGVVPDSSLTVAFLAAYERARFSSKPLTDDDFQSLMRMFAELLRNMTPVDVEMLDLDSSLSAYGSHSDTSDMSARHHALDLVQTLSDPSTLSDTGSVQHHRPIPSRVSEDSVPSFTSSSEHNAPTEPAAEPDPDANAELDDEDARSLQTAPTNLTAPTSRSRLSLSQNSNANSNARLVSAASASSSSLGSGASNESIARSVRSSRSGRSGRSNRSQGQGSVIRLTRAGEDEEMPFRIRIPGRSR